MQSNFMDEYFFEDRMRHNKESAKLKDQRKQAWSKISGLPLPKVERVDMGSWNLFDINRDLDKGYDRKSLSNAFLHKWTLPNAMHLVFDGDQVIDHSKINLQNDQPFILSWEDALISKRDLMHKYVFSEKFVMKNKLFAVHQALYTGIALIYLPSGTNLDTPLQITLNLDAHVGSFPYILVVAKDNVCADISIMNVGSADTLHSLLDVHLAQNAQVRLSVFDQAVIRKVGTFQRRAYLGKDSELTWIISESLKGKIVSETTDYLAEPGSKTNVKTLGIGTGTSDVCFSIQADHLAQNTKSNLHTRIVVCDESSNIVNNITKINNGAKGADGRQTTRLLMLSPKARGDANPILLIDENDVMAGHAASVGKIDPMQLYYFLARGIPESKAEKMLIKAFLMEIVSEVSWVDLRSLINDQFIKGVFV